MIDMKRKLIKIIVALCMTFCLLLVGCGQKTAGNAQDGKKWCCTDLLHCAG